MEVEVVSQRLKEKGLEKKWIISSIVRGGTRLSLKIDPKIERLLKDLEFGRRKKGAGQD